LSAVSSKEARSFVVLEKRFFECERVFGSAKGRQEEELVREKMSSVGRKKGLLEVFKFATYVAIPVVMMYAFANNSENLEKIIRNRSYVVYPPEGPRPPSGDEIRDLIKKNKVTPS